MVITYGFLSLILVLDRSFVASIGFHGPKATGVCQEINCSERVSREFSIHVLASIFKCTSDWCNLQPRKLQNVGSKSIIGVKQLRELNENTLVGSLKEFSSNGLPDVSTVFIVADNCKELVCCPPSMEILVVTDTFPKFTTCK